LGIVTRDIRALLGFMPVDEAVAFQGIICQPATGEGEPEFRARWATAEAKIRALQPLTDFNADPRPLTAPAQAAASALSQDAAFKAVFGPLPPTFASVRLDRLLTAQKYVDAMHVDGLQVPDSDDEAAVLEFCMRANPIDPPMVGADGGITFSSHYSQNLIPLNPSFRVVSDREVCVTATIISRPNYVQLTIWNGRFVIANGYHRAVALLQAGHTRMPCILQGTPLEGVGIVPPNFFDTTRLGAARPPMMSDFALGVGFADPLKLRARNHILRVGFQVQQFEAPR